MLNENEQVEVVDESTTDVEDNDTSYEETNSEGEGDGAAQEGDRQPETPEAKYARLKRQAEQLAKKHGFEDSKESGEETPKKEVTADERYDRLELKTEGVKDKKQQDAVIEYARFKKMDVLDALNSPAMKAELKAMQAKAATPAPSGRTSAGRTEDVESWARQLTQSGKLAPTPELRTKVRDYLAKK